MRIVLPRICCRPCVSACGEKEDQTPCSGVPLPPPLPLPPRLPVTHLGCEDVDGVAHAAQHLGLPKHRVYVAHDGIYRAKGQTDIVDLARHPARDSHDQVDPLVVVQRSVFKRLDRARPPLCRLASDVATGAGRARGDDGGSPGTRQESSGPRDADGREASSQAGSDHGSQEAGRQTNDQTASDRGETHHHVSSLQRKLAPRLHVLVLVPVLLLGILLHLQRVRHLLFKPANVDPGNLQGLGYPLQEHSRPRIVDGIRNEHQEKVAQHGPAQVNVDLLRRRHGGWKLYRLRELASIVGLVCRWWLRRRLLPFQTRGLHRGRRPRTALARRDRFPVFGRHGILDTCIHHQDWRQILRHHAVLAQLLDHDLLRRTDVHV